MCVCVSVCVCGGWRYSRAVPDDGRRTVVNPGSVSGDAGSLSQGPTRVDTNNEGHV